MSDKTKDKDEERPDEKATVTLPGTVEKIIPPITPNQPEKAHVWREKLEENSKAWKPNRVVTQPEFVPPPREIP